MTNYPKKLLVSIFVFAIALAVNAQLSNPYYSNNESVAFVGNSITRNGEFHAIISIFQATRFPHQSVIMNNYGCGGNKTADVIKRINGDIMESNPSCISLMLGMNDIVHSYYSPSLLVNGEFTANALSNQQLAKNTYYQNMRGILKIFRENGKKILLQSPTMYDEKLTVVNSTANLCNKPLGVLRDSVLRWANEFDLKFVDYYSIMNLIDSTEKIKDSNFTIVSSDRIHPQTLGHFVMAYAYLKALNMPSVVSDVEISAIDNNIVKQNNATVSLVNLNSTSGGTFKVLSKALPMPLIGGSEKALSWEYFDFYNELNREILTIKGLQPDKIYSLTIGDKFVSNFTGNDFSVGINLAQFVTPQNEQAQSIRNLLYNKRSLESKRRGMRSCEFSVLTEQEFATLTMEQKVARVVEYNTAHPGALFYYDNYDVDRPNEVTIISQIHTIEEQVLALQQMKELTYTIGDEKEVVPNTVIENFEINPLSYWSTNPAIGSCVRDVVTNPCVDNVNNSGNVLKISKTGSSTAASWNHVYSLYYRPVVNKQNCFIEMKVLFRQSENTINNTTIQFRAGGASSGASQFPKTLTASENWQTLRFDFSTLPTFSSKFNLNKDSVLSYIGVFPRVDADQNSSIVMYVDDIAVISKLTGFGTLTPNSTLCVGYNNLNSSLSFTSLPNEVCSIDITNLSGIRLMQLKSDNKNFEVNVSNLKTGVYLLSCYSASGYLYRGKFIKR